MQTSFTTVIVTRNRPDALALALPLHLNQSRHPDQLLIVDSSDDPSMNQQLVHELSANSPFPIIHQTAPKGISVQRNIGLDQVKSEVVFMPDDDSLLHPQTLDRMMRIYDLDTEGRIGGVCGIETRTPPPGTLEVRPTVYRKRRSDKLKGLITPRINRFENRHFPDPMKHAARRLMAAQKYPAWMASERAVPVEWMTGFRMSFRTPALAAVRFNELLGRYSLFEDVDAGLGVLANGQLLVGAEDAPVYHHRSPENRSNGQTMGAIQILNRAYVTCRHGPADAERDRTIRRFSQFRQLQFRLLAQRNAYERDRSIGAAAAIRQLPRLLASAPSGLDSTYMDIRQQCLAND